MGRRWKRALVKMGVLAVLLLAAAVVITYRQGGFIREQVSPESSGLIAGYEGLALTTRVGPPARDVIYFVMVDRFANGDPSNDTGAGGSGPLEHGYDPTRPQFYHGGDLLGLRQKLDYIQGLGATALWLTPVLTNKPVQMNGDEVLTTGYHGYGVSPTSSRTPTRRDLQQRPAPRRSPLRDPVRPDSAGLQSWQPHADLARDAPPGGSPSVTRRRWATEPGARVRSPTA